MSKDEEQMGPKNFNEPLEYVKAVAGKALKWAAIGALVGGAMMAFFPAMIGAAFSTITLGYGGGIAAGGVAAAFGAGALQGGILAGAIGAVMGIADAGDVVDEKREQATLREQQYRNRMLREQNVANALEAKNLDLVERQSQLMAGATPGFPRGKLRENDSGPGVR